MKQIALLGGSFNPPHVGHVMAALYVRTTLQVDEVWLVPSFHHPFGKDLAPFEARVEMCEAIAKEIGPWLKVSRAESEVGGEGRTIELLEWLLPKQAGTKFRWVIGSDILADLPKWKAWDRIQQLVEVTVLHRAGYPASNALGPPLAEVSSTEIRKRLSAGDAPSELVPAAALKVARERGLYGLSAPSPRAPLATEPRGEDDEDTALLKEQFAAARAYFETLSLGAITASYFGAGTGGIVASFLFHHGAASTWVITGDIPTAHFPGERAADGMAALGVYCELMDQWADAVLNGGASDGGFSMRATPQNARALINRIELIREIVLPEMA